MTSFILVIGSMHRLARAVPVPATRYTDPPSLYAIYFFFVLVEPLGSSAVNGKKSRPCMYGCSAFGILIP